MRRVMRSESEVVVFTLRLEMKVGLEGVAALSDEAWRGSRVVLWRLLGLVVSRW